MDRAEWQAFGAWIESLRMKAGLQNVELAQRADVSLQWLQALRKGGRLLYGQWQLPNPKNEALARLARALDVPLDEMLARAGRAPASAPEAEQSEAEEADADRIRQLETQVAQHEQDLAELRRLLQDREVRNAR